MSSHSRCTLLTRLLQNYEDGNILDLILKGRCMLALDPKVIALHLNQPRLSLCDLLGNIVSVLVLSQALVRSHCTGCKVPDIKPGEDDETPVAAQTLDYVIALIVPGIEISATALQQVSLWCDIQR